MQEMCSGKETEEAAKEPAIESIGAERHPSAMNF